MRPFPPPDLFDQATAPAFIPSTALQGWAKATFINAGAPLHNPDHELYHCGQEIDQYGAPKFSRSTGLPVFAIRGHDVEEFVGVVRRYGVGAAAGQTLALVEAAQRRPEIGKAKVTGACGSCRALIV